MPTRFAIAKGRPQRAAKVFEPSTPHRTAVAREPSEPGQSWKMDTRKKVLIGPSSFGELDDTPLKYLKESGFDVVPNPFQRKLNRAELLDLLADDVVGLIAGLEPLDREVLEASSLKVVSRCGVGCR